MSEAEAAALREEITVLEAFLASLKTAGESPFAGKGTVDSVDISAELK